MSFYIFSIHITNAPTGIHTHISNRHTYCQYITAYCAKSTPLMIIKVRAQLNQPTHHEVIPTPKLKKSIKDLFHQRKSEGDTYKEKRTKSHLLPTLKKEAHKEEEDNPQMAASYYLTNYKAQKDEEETTVHIPFNYHTFSHYSQGRRSWPQKQ